MSANSSRRRVDSEPIPSDSGQGVARKAQGIYEQLSQTVPSTRFLTIKPASRPTDRICCEVSEVAFGDRVSFEALSYRWGTEKAVEAIVLNGVEVNVQQNLLDLLRHLRGSFSSGSTTGSQGEEGEMKKKRYYWIDALCINQQDKDERSAQVKFMRQIYFRASTVIVWLGKKYERYAEELPQLQFLGCEAAAATVTPEEFESAGDSAENSSASSRLARELYEDEYWKRVWIVQEVGLAERLVVCFGNCVTDWDTFIRLLTVKNVGSKGPMKLNDLRRRRYEGSCELLQLLREYRDAECEKRRDKVYGLIGLASDVHLFPVDYRKSLFEVWKDVMVFANGHELLADDEVISVGGLVKYLLMGTKCEPLDQMLRSYKPEQEGVTLIENPSSPQVFRVPGKVLGCVKNVSFRPEEIVDDPNKQELWEQTVQRYYRKDAGRAHAESDMLLRMILRPGGRDPAAVCFTYSSGVQWTESIYSRDHMLDRWVGDTINRLQEISNGGANASESDKQLESPAETARLYQLESFFSRHDWKMGIASGQVQLGDLICWVESSRMAVILRPRTDNVKFTFRAVGTAVVAKDLTGTSIADHRQRYQRFPESCNPSSANLPVHLDATFLFILLDDASLGKSS